MLILFTAWNRIKNVDYVQQINQSIIKVICEESGLGCGLHYYLYDGKFKVD
jgi:hypothetical protein